ncbi:MAG: glutathione S-transferase family protein [Minwuia sp.]|uniref:glutathione S-transferase family protein n=1 Tax=Minwuia sp. TaxID=2493630 RepID=UPI003A88BBC4
MKFYNSVGPNPRMVRIFMAEKGVTPELVDVDLRGGENRQSDYMTKVNPMGQLPALVLDDGQVITEITAICEYLDEIGKGDSLIGKDARERAETRMWTRRIDLHICETMGAAFRFGPGLKMFQSRIHCIPAAAEDFAQIAQEKIAWLNDQMDGKEWVCGDRFTMADILLFAFLEFGANVGQAVNDNNKNVIAWMERMKARPSAAA